MCCEFIAALPSIDAVNIINPLADTAVMEDEGGVVIFTCTARGVPQPSITWSPAAGGRIETSSGLAVTDEDGFISVNSTLTISNLRRSDAGSYVCTASNSVVGPNSPETRVFTVRVNICKYKSTKGT